MWRKLAFLRLVAARHRWSLLNKRYRNLVNKFRKLPQKQFLVKAYKKYTKSAEFAVRRHSKAYQRTAKKSAKYLANLGMWAKTQQNRILGFAARMKRYLKKNGRRLGAGRVAQIRKSFRARLAKEQSRIAHIISYWKSRIGSGRIPAVRKGKSRAQLLKFPKAKRATPMVPYLAGAKHPKSRRAIRQARRAARRAAHKDRNGWFKPISTDRHYRNTHPRHHRHGKKPVSRRVRKWQNKVRSSIRAAWSK